jgi:hypothetical protein
MPLIQKQMRANIEAVTRITFRDVRVYMIPVGDFTTVPDKKQPDFRSNLA